MQKQNSSNQYQMIRWHQIHIKTHIQSLPQIRVQNEKDYENGTRVSKKK